MKLLTTFFILAAALSAAPVTQVKLINAGNPSVIASSVTVDGDTKHNVYIGPYTLLINGQDYAALCVAFFDESHVNDTWNAYVTQVGSGNFSNTYNPTEGQEYEEDSYIMSQILKPGSDRTGLQEAAWDIMAYGITNSSYKYLIGDNSYIDAALADYSTMNFTGYEIISDTTKNGEQEFLVATPEPGSFLLLGVGLMLAMSAIVMRRRRLAAVRAS
jgi:hypothetical protein